MSDPDNFLSRWSRRKREAGTRPDKGEEANPVPERDGGVDSERPISPPAAPPQVPEFDVSKLPPIESIGADTDISVFMQKGVPSALRHAALRRAWSADPAIRDFIGPNENFWDAAGPDGIAGFGDLGPGLDVKRMVAELFGEAPPASTPSSIDLVPGDKNSTDRDEGKKSLACDPPSTISATEGSLSHTEKYAAAQQDLPQPQPQSPKKILRRHGGAMPQ